MTRVPVAKNVPLLSSLNTQRLKAWLWIKCTAQRKDLLDLLNLQNQAVQGVMLE